ncbi:MAG: L-2-hydroxyglutarate oxidase [Coxiellaceae bacterium]|nr:L-2-hydroxyglutarate oxidase [Coxiellaceae bacterium]
MTSYQTDTLIIGGGILALTIARELVKQGADDIVIVDKEPELAMHASGRNSGVMHAGIYYPSESLKAKFCLNGNLKMQAYCQQNGLPVNRCGKVVVTKDESELGTLHTLYERAIANGAKVEMLDQQQLADIEPWAKTVDKALYSHYTAVVDPKRIMQCLRDELVATRKVRFLMSCFFRSLKTKTIANTSQGDITYRYCINAAGTYADQVAHQFGLAKHLVMIPFKGIYRRLVSEQAHRVNGNIYPVPNIHNPFLGVHFTKNIHGEVYAGPTAIPAFGRENYGLLKGIDKEAVSIMAKSAQLFFCNKKFRQVALTEPRKYWSGHFYRCAKRLVKELKPTWLKSSPKAGIRPQLVDWRNKELVMDFMVETTDNSVHLLNAISPAFTSSMAVAEDIVNRVILQQQQLEPIIH